MDTVVIAYKHARRTLSGKTINPFLTTASADHLEGSHTINYLMPRKLKLK